MIGLYCYTAQYEVRFGKKIMNVLRFGLSALNCSISSSSRFTKFDNIPYFHRIKCAQLSQTRLQNTAVYHTESFMKFYLNRI
jgi:hypothetical protein